MTSNKDSIANGDDNDNGEDNECHIWMIHQEYFRRHVGGKIPNPALIKVNARSSHGTNGKELGRSHRTSVFQI